MQDTTAFETAKANMDHDHNLLEDLKSGKTDKFSRFYIWKCQGITYPYNRELPKKYHHIDHSKRDTGGGIVFHEPGDIVFAIGAKQNDPNWPKGMKAKLQHLSDTLGETLANHGLQTQPGGLEPEDQNILYCNSYHNPYERTADGKKVVAIAMRSFRDVFMMQGVIKGGAKLKPEIFLKNFR